MAWTTWKRSTIFKNAIDAYPTGDPTEYRGKVTVEGLGNGLGRATAATTLFKIEAATDVYGPGDERFEPTLGWNGWYGVGPSTTPQRARVEIEAAGRFTPGKGASKFDTVKIDHVERGAEKNVYGNFFEEVSNSFVVNEEEVVRGKSADTLLQKGFTFDVRAEGLATPVVDGAAKYEAQTSGNVYAYIDVIYDVKPVAYGNDADKVKGTNAADFVKLGGGNDRFYGKRGDDVAQGGSGKDRMWGDDGADRMSGGSGK